MIETTNLLFFIFPEFHFLSQFILVRAILIPSIWFSIENYSSYLTDNRK